MADAEIQEQEYNVWTFCGFSCEGDLYDREGYFWGSGCRSADGEAVVYYSLLFYFGSEGAWKDVRHSCAEICQYAAAENQETGGYCFHSSEYKQKVEEKCVFHINKN